MRPQLQSAWRTVKLGEVCVQDRQIIEPRSVEAQRRPYLSLEHIASGSGEILKDESVAVEDEGRSSTFAFDSRHVLYRKLRPYLNKVALPDFAGRCTTELIPLLPSAGTDRDFLALVLRRQETLTVAMQDKTGSRMPRADMDSLLKMAIPLPPVDEQRRMAVRLQEQMATVERARTAVQAQLDAAQELPAALLRAVFTSPAAERWPRRKLGEVIQVQSGYTFKSDWFCDDGIRLLRNVNVAQGRTNWEDTVYLPQNRRTEFPDYELNEGDIILSLDRPVVSGGLKLTRLTKDDLPALLLQRVGRIILKDGIDAGFLYHFLQTNDFVRTITAHDQSLGVPHVSPKQIEQIEVPSPISLTEQRAIATRLGSELGVAHSLCESLETRSSEIELLPAALLREAFGSGDGPPPQARAGFKWRRAVAAPRVRAVKGLPPAP